MTGGLTHTHTWAEQGSVLHVERNGHGKRTCARSLEKNKVHSFKGTYIYNEDGGRSGGHSIQPYNGRVVPRIYVERKGKWGRRCGYSGYFPLKVASFLCLYQVCIRKRADCLVLFTCACNTVAGKVGSWEKNKKLNLNKNNRNESMENFL